MDHSNPPQLRDLKDVKYVIVPSNGGRKSRKRQEKLAYYLGEGYRVLRIGASRRTVHWLLVKFENKYAPRYGSTATDGAEDAGIDDAES